MAREWCSHLTQSTGTFWSRPSTIWMPSQDGRARRRSPRSSKNSKRFKITTRQSSWSHRHNKRTAQKEAVSIYWPTKARMGAIDQRAHSPVLMEAHSTQHMSREWDLKKSKILAPSPYTRETGGPTWRGISKTWTSQELRIRSPSRLRSPKVWIDHSHWVGTSHSVKRINLLRGPNLRAMKPCLRPKQAIWSTRRGVAWVRT